MLKPPHLSLRAGLASTVDDYAGLHHVWTMENSMEFDIIKKTVSSLQRELKVLAARGFMEKLETLAGYTYNNLMHYEETEMSFTLAEGNMVGMVRTYFTNFQKAI